MTIIMKGIKKRRNKANATSIIVFDVSKKLDNVLHGVWAKIDEMCAVKGSDMVERCEKHDDDSREHFLNLSSKGRQSQLALMQQDALCQGKYDQRCGQQGFQPWFGLSSLLGGTAWGVARYP